MSSKYQKVVFEYPVREIHGKPCSHTSTTVTAGMLAQRNLFRDASNYAKTQMTDATKRAAAEVRFNAQTRYHMLRTYLMAEFMAGNQVGD